MPWSRRLDWGPRLLDGSKVSYDIGIIHVLPTPLPAGVTQVWQVVKISRFRIDRGCKVHAETEYIIDVVDIAGRTEIKDQLTWIRRDDSCLAIEIAERTIGFDDGTRYEQYSSLVAKKSLAERLLANMQGPKDTHFTRYFYVNKALCDGCTWHWLFGVIPDGEGLEVEGVGRWSSWPRPNTPVPPAEGTDDSDHDSGTGTETPGTETPSETPGSETPGGSGSGSHAPPGHAMLWPISRGPGGLRFHPLLRRHAGPKLADVLTLRQTQRLHAAITAVGRDLPLSVDNEDLVTRSEGPGLEQASRPLEWSLYRAFDDHGLTQQQIVLRLRAEPSGTGGRGALSIDLGGLKVDLVLTTDDGRSPTAALADYDTDPHELGRSIQEHVEALA